jgi:hypothetical protein
MKKKAQIESFSPHFSINRSKKAKMQKDRKNGPFKIIIII